MAIGDQRLYYYPLVTSGHDITSLANNEVWTEVDYWPLCMRLHTWCMHVVVIGRGTGVFGSVGARIVRVVRVVCGVGRGIVELVRCLCALCAGTGTVTSVRGAVWSFR